MNRIIHFTRQGMLATAFCMVAHMASAQSPAAQTSVELGGKTISVKYSAPSVRGRDIFGAAGLISKETNFPIWRAGANAATAFHTDADLKIGNLDVPKGDYTLFVNIADANNWELVINKQTGQGGLTYKAENDLGRVKMKMSTPGAPIEQLNYKLTLLGNGKASLTLGWEKHIGEVQFTVR